MLLKTVHNFYRSSSTGLLGLNSLQGRDNAVLQLLTDLEGMGLLDAYLVNVEHYEYRGGCIGNGSSYDLASVDHCEHAIGSWMRLDGSNPCFSDMKDMDIGECVMQVSICVVCLIMSVRQADLLPLII